jgi:hypothetical protein
MADETPKPATPEVRKKPTYPSAPMTYASVLHGLRERLKEKGYALAIHGSLQRDMDLVAVPWTEEAVPPDVIVKLVQEYTGGMIVHDEKAYQTDYMKHSPHPLPHGRMAWSLHLGGGPYIDLSIMPLAGRLQRKIDLERELEYMSPIQRLQLFANYCRHCGSAHPPEAACCCPTVGAKEQEPKAACYDCGRPYEMCGDVSMDDAVWMQISPTGDEGGLLCANCTMNRLAVENIRGAQVTLWPPTIKYEYPKENTDEQGPGVEQP